MQVTVKNQQWLGDIALQESGSIEAIFLLAQANGLSITETLETGSIMAIGGHIINREVVNYYNVNEIEPATGMTQAEQDAEPGGIGYMQIQTDFKIS